MDATSNTPAQKPTDGSTILVVDDDMLLLNMSELVLREFGYRVLLAASGQAAMEMMQSHAEELDLVVLDLRMPGLDGMSVMRQARSSWPKLKILLVTGFAAEDVRRSFLEAGAVGVLEKPYDIDTFTTVVRQALQAPPPAALRQ